jgi:hypothetical protein
MDAFGECSASYFLFIVGYISHADPVSLQKMNVKDDYFREGMILSTLLFPFS